MDYLTPDEISEQTADLKPIIIYGGPLFDGQGNVYEDGALLVQDGNVQLVGSEEEVFEKLDRAIDMDVLDTQGRVIFPGMVNLHHDFMAPLKRGLSPVAPVTNYREKLENLDWKFEQVLDDEAIQLATLLSIMDSIRYGVTTIFNHHSSTGIVSGSQDIIASVIEKAEIRAVLSHEISDHAGKDVFQKQLSENLQFIEKHRDDPAIKGMLGMHANYTLSENSLAEIVKQYNKADGIHIYCGGGAWDKSYCKDLGYKGCVHRLSEYELISEKSILSDSLHLSRCDITLVENTKAVLVHNPEANASNNVGQMEMPPINGVTVGLGTDGMSSSILGAIRSAYLLQRNSGIEETVLEKRLAEFAFTNNADCASRFLNGKPGVLSEGAQADVVVLDYVPPTPFHSNNFMKHLVLGMYSSRANTVVSNGKIIYRDNTFLTLDEQLVHDESREASRRIWHKYVELA